MTATPTLTPALKSTAATQSRLSASGGTTTIADTVVAKIAAVAAREIPGVVDLVPGTIGETVAGIAQRVTRRDQRGMGVSVEVGQRETAVDMNLKVEYGVNIADVATRVRENVVEQIEAMTGLIAKEVNLNVLDVHFQDDAALTDASPRVE